MPTVDDASGGLSGVVPPQGTGTSYLPVATVIAGTVELEGTGANTTTFRVQYSAKV